MCAEKNEALGLINFDIADHVIVFLAKTQVIQSQSLCEGLVPVDIPLLTYTIQDLV